MATTDFWKTKSLDEMTTEEWELLCDGCARCCLHKLQDEDSGDIYYTKIACRLLDLDTCRCSNYANRVAQVAECVVLKPNRGADLAMLPASCAYRRLADGRSLAWWHPLLSGDPNTVHAAGISVRGKAASEVDAGPADDDTELYAL